jgi:hypothetical protein
MSNVARYRLKTAGKVQNLLTALKPLRSYAATGAGLGAGIGGVAGFRGDDPNESFEHHVLRGAQGALTGSAIGALTGLGGGAAFRKLAPEGFAAMARGPFSDAAEQVADSMRRERMAQGVFEDLRHDPEGRNIPDHVWSALNEKSDPFAKAKAYAQKAYEGFMHPATRLALGAYTGHSLASAYDNSLADYRLQQLAARKGRSTAEEGHEEENSALEALKARYHMGEYNSSLDRRAPATRK